ncbi:hypothetical protein [Deinococcus hohokamensis]|uniref:Uncharacterized protein n=1 Tax=Deinococcus hohokamensis TaxID=309883 RepID=A0ABV9I939_9DEIO
MYTPGPSLLVIVPGDWNVVPEGVAELKRYLADEYGATLMMRTTTARLRSPLALQTGVWAPATWRFAWRDIEQVLLPQAFFSLEWMDEVS